MNRSIICVFALLSLNVTANSELDRNASPVNAVATLLSNTPIKDAPPHGLFNLFVGQTIENTTQDIQVQVIGKKTYGGFDGVNVWYQVKPIDNLKSVEGKPLWIYGGVEGKGQQVLFTDVLGGSNGN
ncbi:hypothetical protein M0358_002385 [Vibrio fluvialis]|nr:hypothetical protein [Vibrio fluvialis]